MPPKKTAPIKTAAPIKTTTVSKAKASSTTPKSKGIVKTGPGSSDEDAPVGKKGSKTASPAPKKPIWTPQDEAAKKIQTKARQFLAKKALERKKKEKEEYEELMLKLEREAYLHLVKMEQEEQERKNQKEDEERRRKIQEKKRKQRMLEAAFDGDIDIMKDVLKEVSDVDTKNNVGNDVIGRSVRTRHLMSVIDCEDANGNTPLSEAANGGNADAVRWLLEKGAEPNTQGQWQRTPLWRAAFMGHLEATQILLENGADPRIYSSDSQTPEQVASQDSVKQILQNWDIKQTESLQKKIQAAKDKRAAEDKQRREAETQKAEDVVIEAEKDYETKQKTLKHAYCELEKRITEHDTCVQSGFDRPELTIQAIHDAELTVETMKLDVDNARDKLAKARLLLREAMASENEDVEDKLPGLRIMVKDLDDVLIKDVGNKIKDSGKWPMLIDTSGQAATFLRYRDVNYLCTLRPKDLEPDNTRRALLGAIRYGKPFVVDMMEVDMFQTVTDRFDEIQKGLMESLIDKSLIKDDRFLKLVKPDDGPEYQKNNYNDVRMANFKFVLVTKNPFPNEILLDRFYTIRVILPH